MPPAIVVFSVLVVDDFEPWRCYVRSKLGDYNYLQVVGEATGGAEAVQKATELKPDLILLDIGLPDMNGIEVAKRIRQTNPCSRIVFATLDSDVDVKRAALATGAAGYLLKAEAECELLPVIEMALQDGHQR